MTKARQLLETCASYDEAYLNALKQANKITSHVCKQFYFNDNSAIEIHFHNDTIEKVFVFNFNEEQ